MTKYISEEKLVQHFKDIADFELPADAVRRDLADIKKLLKNQESATSPAGKNIWRMIMQNKTTRYVSAAMIFFAVFIAMQFLPESELNAAQLLTKVSKNMRQFKIVKYVTGNYLPGQAEPVSSEIAVVDYDRKQSFITFSHGWLHQMDFKNMIWSIYRPEDNTMIVKPLVGEWTDPDEEVDKYIEKLSQEGLEVHQSELLNDGVKLTVIEYDEILNNIGDPEKYMSNTLMGNTIVKRIHTKLTVNRDDLYLSQDEMSYYDPQDNLIITKKSTSEPAEYAPRDIYELGVPDDVKIINKVPDERVKEVRELIKQNQSRFLKNYVAIQLENTVNNDGSETLVEGMVIYSQGKKLRVDVFRRKYPSDDDNKAMLDQVEALMADSKVRIQPYVSREFCPRAIRIYDGLWQYNLDEYDGEFIVRSPQRRPDGDEYVDDDIDDFGWRVLWMLGESEWMYEDDFSLENDLLAMEVTWQSQAGWSQLPERKVLYVDPAKDYCFRRYIEEKRADAPWQMDENWLESVENKWNIVEKTSITDVTEYAQTSEGQWYPKTMHLKMMTHFPFRDNRDKTYEKNRVIRIYLFEENPDLPDALFDPKILSTIELQKQ